MWPLVLSYARRSPQVMLPFTIVLGYIGYKIEGWFSTRYTPPTDAIKEQRDERMLENIDSMTSTITDKPKHSPLEVNLSPSLSR